MKKVMLSLFTFTIVFAHAQKTSYKKKPTLAIRLVLNDFNTADLIKKNSLGSVLNNKDWSRIKDMDAGFALQYLQGLTKEIDLAARMDITYLDYLFKNRPPLGTDNPLLETDVSAHAKLLPDNYLISPYVACGLGISKYTSYWGLYMPLGVGLQISLGPAEVYFFTDFQYRVPLTSNVNNHFNYSIGFGAPIGGRNNDKSTPLSPF